MIPFDLPCFFFVASQLRACRLLVDVQLNMVNYCWWLKSGDHQLRLVVYPIIHRVSYIPGGCLRFQPSTVSTRVNHVQNEISFIKSSLFCPAMNSISIPIMLTKKHCGVGKSHLVGGFNPSEKYESQIGSFPPNRGKHKKNISKHHLVMLTDSIFNNQWSVPSLKLT